MKKHTILFSLLICRVAKFFLSRHYINSHKTLSLKFTSPIPIMLPSFSLSYFRLSTKSSMQIPKSFVGPRKAEQKCHCPIKASSSLGFWHIVKNLASSFLRDWILHPNSDLLEKVCVCVCNSPYFIDKEYLLFWLLIIS